MKYLEFIVERKELFTIVFVASLFLAYGGIYFFVDEQFESTATIVPRGDEDIAGISSLLRGMRGLPLGLGTSAPTSETDLYTTVLESRTLLEKVIREFDLLDVYDIDTTEYGYMEEAIKTLRDNITARETDEAAFLISARSTTRDRSAAMTNYLVREMNAMIISLKVSRSRENRIFLGERVKEIRAQLQHSEDSLRVYQERTGMLDAKEQLEGILSVHTLLESELAARELQKGILERQFDRTSPQVREVDIQIDAYRKKIGELRRSGNPGGPLIALDKVPRTAVEFLRRYREIEINQLLLEFIMPLYEQAKVEEKKDYPVLQVIDYAVPPRKRVWPPRVLLSAACAVSVSIIVFFYLLIRENIASASDPDIQRLLSRLRVWSWRRRRDD